MEKTLLNSHEGKTIDVICLEAALLAKYGKSSNVGNGFRNKLYGTAGVTAKGVTRNGNRKPTGRNSSIGKTVQARIGSVRGTAWGFLQSVTPAPSNVSLNNTVDMDDVMMDDIYGGEHESFDSPSKLSKFMRASTNHTEDKPQQSDGQTIIDNHEQFALSDVYGELESDVFSRTSGVHDEMELHRYKKALDDSTVDSCSSVSNFEYHFECETGDAFKNHHLKLESESGSDVISKDTCSSITSELLANETDVESLRPRDGYNIDLVEPEEKKLYHSLFTDSAIVSGAMDATPESAEPIGEVEIDVTLQNPDVLTPFSSSCAPPSRFSSLRQFTLKKGSLLNMDRNKPKPTVGSTKQNNSVGAEDSKSTESAENEVNTNIRKPLVPRYLPPPQEPSSKQSSAIEKHPLRDDGWDVDATHSFGMEQPKDPTPVLLSIQEKGKEKDIHSAKAKEAAERFRMRLQEAKSIKSIAGNKDDNKSNSERPPVAVSKAADRFHQLLKQHREKSGLGVGALSEEHDQTVTSTNTNTRAVGSNVKSHIASSRHISPLKAMTEVLTRREAVDKNQTDIKRSEGIDSGTVPSSVMTVVPLEAKSNERAVTFSAEVLDNPSFPTKKTDEGSMKTKAESKEEHVRMKFRQQLEKHRSQHLVDI